MTKEELGQSIKQKYPQYNTISDTELADKMIAKYPVYQKQITDISTTPTAPISPTIKPQTKTETPIKTTVKQEVNPIYGKTFQPTKETGLLGIATGIGKGLLSSVRGVTALSEKSLSQTAGRVGNVLSGKGFIPTKTYTEQVIPKELVETPTTSQKIGKTAEQIGEFFVPGTASLKAGKAVKGAIKGGETLKKAAGLATTGGSEFLLGTGQSAIQSGKLGKEELQSGVISLAAPALISGVSKLKPNAVKKLSLNLDELSKVKNLEYLKKDKLAGGATKGGLFTSKQYETPKEVVSLADEFKDILKGSPEKIIQKAKKEGLKFKDKTFELFTNNEKAINEKTVRKQLEKALGEDVSTSYASEFEKQDVAKKAINGFLNKVKIGTNKGLEEARLNWYAEAKKASGKLSDANKVIHDAIKKVVKESLPTESQKSYDLFKTKMAKLFDIQEIQKAKVKATIGTSKTKELIKKAALIGGTAAALEGARRIFK